jgi:hypothetical protein
MDDLYNNVDSNVGYAVAHPTDKQAKQQTSSNSQQPTQPTVNRQPSIIIQTTTQSDNGLYWLPPYPSPHSLHLMAWFQSSV